MGIWRLVFAGKASLQELETTWSRDDCERANAILDYEEYVQKLTTPKTPGK